MIDADKLLHPTKEELIKFDSDTNIIKIDNQLKLNNTIYELTDFDLMILNQEKIKYGYDKNYFGPEKNKGDAQRINRMMIAHLYGIIEEINNHIEHNCLKRKIIMKII